MSAGSLLVWLAYSTCASSIAIVLVLLLRKPMRHLAGARVAYALWWLVPLVLLAAMVPARRTFTPMAPAESMLAFINGRDVAAVLPQTASHSSWIIAVWLFGMASMLAWLSLQQRRFVRSLGHLQCRADGLWLAESRAGLPAVIGLVHPRIVLPADFFARYDAQEQTLMLLHENAHRASFDLPAHALCAAMRVLFWFNPLLHLAVPRFRQDQELACDARVLQQQPGAQRAYAEAMLKTRLADAALPLGCHWGSSHPLKERIMQMQHKSPRASLRLAGAGASLLLALLVSWAAWAMQPSHSTTNSNANEDFEARLELSFDGQAPQPFAIRAGYGEPFAIDTGAPQHARLSGQVVPVRFEGDRLGFRVDLSLQQQGQQLSTPSLVTLPGQNASLSLDGADSRLRVSLVLTPHDEAAALAIATPFVLLGTESH